MRKKLYVVKSFILLLTVSFAIIIMHTLKTRAENENILSPYFTYTINSENQLIRTMEAYSPSMRIQSVNGERFGKLQHVFIDPNDDYVYITDSTNKAIYVLDPNFNYVTKLQDIKIGFPLSTYVTNDKIYVVIRRPNKGILIYDKKALFENNEVVFLQEIGQPDAPVFNEGYPFDPVHIAVDIRGNIYVQSVASTNGLIMLDPKGKFMTFFGGNPYRVPIVEKIRGIFLTETQEKGMTTILPDVPTNLAIDKKGFIYTVTSTINTTSIKKFNVKGTNYFNENMFGSYNMNSIAIGQYNNVLTVTDTGHIFEYDTSGNLLFMFGGNDTSNRIGILNIPVAIAVNKRDQIVVADSGANVIQVYDPTMFANSVHQAIKSYQDGNYEESLDRWQYVIQYNSLFDYARIGLGDAYMRDNRYREALKEYTYARDYDGISEAKWYLRQEWLNDNLFIIFTILVVLGILRLIYYLLNKRYNYSFKIKQGIKCLRYKYRILDELLYIFDFLRHPLNGFYEIKRQNRVSVLTSTIIYVLLAVVYIAYVRFTNILFVKRETINVVYELSIGVFVLLLWVTANYLVCAVSDGEGTLKNVYNSTAFIFTPFIILMPIVILMSHVITYQERVFYDFTFVIMIVWTVFLFFFQIKDIHNYEVLETIGIVLKSIFTMIMIALCIFIINALGYQMFTVIREIVTEVVRR